MKRSKRYKSSAEKVDREKAFELEEGIQLLKQMGSVKFDESVDVAVRLGVDPKKRIR